MWKLPFLLGILASWLGLTLTIRSGIRLLLNSRLFVSSAPSSTLGCNMMLGCIKFVAFTFCHFSGNFYPLRLRSRKQKRKHCEDLHPAQATGPPQVTCTNYQTDLASHMRFQAYLWPHSPPNYGFTAMNIRTTIIKWISFKSTLLWDPFADKSGTIGTLIALYFSFGMLFS